MEDNIPVMSESEQFEARKYLAISHEDGICHIYGDDGELQCNNWQRHGRCIDFRRENFQDLIDIVTITRLKEHKIIKSDLSPSDIIIGMKSHLNNKD